MSAFTAPRGIVQRSASGLAIGFACYVALAMSARWWWWGEVAASGRWYAGFAGLALAAAIAALRRPRTALAVGVGATLQLAPSAPLYAPSAHVEPARTSTLLVANLLWGNPDAPRAIEGLRASGPDVAAFVEVGLPARRAILALADVYPGQAWFPARDELWNEGTWGLAIVAREPLEAVARRRIVEGHFPLLECRVRLEGGSALLRLAHAPDPTTAGRWELRERFLDGIARLAWPEDALLLGDLNVTSTSPTFGALVDATRLADSRRGRGRQASWRAGPPLQPLRLDLDHVLGGERVVFAARELVPLSGSDHDAVRVELVLR